MYYLLEYFSSMSIKPITLLGLMIPSSSASAIGLSDQGRPPIAKFIGSGLCTRHLDILTKLTSLIFSLLTPLIVDSFCAFFSSKPEFINTAVNNLGTCDLSSSTS